MYRTDASKHAYVRVRRDKRTECKRKATRTAEMSAHLWAQLCGMRPLWSAQKNVLLPSPPLSAPLWGVCYGNKHQTHINTDSQTHTSPYFSLVVLTHIVLPHFTIKKRKRKKTATQRTALTLHDCGVDINLFGSDNTWQENANATNKKMSACITANRRISCVYHQLFLHSVFFFCRCYLTTVLHHVAMGKSTDCWP